MYFISRSNRAWSVNTERCNLNSPDSKSSTNNSSIRSKWLVLITGIRGMSFLRLSKEGSHRDGATTTSRFHFKLCACAATLNFSRRNASLIFLKNNVELDVFERTFQTTFCNFSFISHVNRSCHQTFTSRECKVIPQVLVAFNIELS